MSNLRNKLNKTANINVTQIKEKLYSIIASSIIEKEREIGHEEEINGVIELVDAYMDSEFNMDIYSMATAICSAVNNWGEKTKENYK